MRKKDIAVSDVLFTSKQSLYLANLLDDLDVHNRYAVAGILHELTKIVKANGSPLSTRKHMLYGFTTDMIDHKLGIKGFSEKAKNFIRVTDEGIEINTFFMTEKFEQSDVARKNASKVRQKRYRDRQKKIPTPVKTTPVKTEVVAVAH